MTKRLPTYLTEAEVNKLLKAPNRSTIRGKRDYALIYLMIQTGLRRNEVCQLKRKNLRIEEKKAWLYVVGKGDKERKLPIKDRKLLDALRIYWENAGILGNPDAPFFLTHGHRSELRGKPVTFRVIEHAIAKRIKQAKIGKNIYPHSLRHTFITRTGQQGVPLHVIQKLAGHSQLSSTQRYFHVEEKELEKAIEKLSL